MNRPLIGFLSFALIISVQGSLFADRPLSKTKLDPSAKQVEMFSAMEEGQIDVKLVARNALGGNLLITNNTDEPLTVQLPEAFAAVPVSAQFGMGGMGGGMGGMGGGMGGMGMGGGMGGMGGGMGGMGGGMQSMGGGMGGGMGGMGGGMGGMGMGGGMGGMGGMGMMQSIPAQKTLRVSFNSVCLNHGLNEPNPRTKFNVIPVDQYTQDPVLQALITMVGTGSLDSQSAQAATWHVTDGLSWEQLANKGKGPVRVPGDNYFSSANIQAAMQISNAAKAQAAERMTNEPDEAKPRTLPTRNQLK
ncbi:hypothetical protein SH668x_001539 [Planctomicrobium sp. SH668]|uniref:hypothetical protein n=1 Tax=Planctomicrobium sp. SH668 TaxID=3448126 RepID=UPI003F5B67DF